MGRILAGLVVGMLLVAGGGALWQRDDPCLGRCGSGTQCKDRSCVVAVAATPATPAQKERHRRARRGNGDSPAAPEVHLQPGDEKMRAEGDALGRPEHLDLSEPDAHELTQEELDQTFHEASPRIEKCITDALGDAPLETGRVEVGLRVEKSGAVNRLRVEAPALLQRQGLTRCVRAAVTALRFPASGASSVVTYPFELK
ncbi:MAG TPA: AgmX/PglI C-terminal domain-containing protein [Polyangia bacterium]|nr:AgmX/PglI C-terminal domain-containing protein [Polyangia bacterium]